jgi:uncharacterized protein (TIGR00297 family)
VLASFLIVAPFAAIAWRLRWLTGDGAIAAWLAGASILALGGPWAVAALGAFFVTGTALTFVGRRKKAQPEHQGGGRDAMQVICTGGVAVITLALARLAGDDAAAATACHAAFLGSLAATAADTWATEIGMLSSAMPRSIATWRPVAPGTSGGITLTGSAAGIAGAAVIATFAPLVAPAAGMIEIALGGTIGMLVDSMLGATVQASFQLPDGAATETRQQDARLVRGVRWVTNPVVNVAAAAAGAMTAAALQYVL